MDEFSDQRDGPPGNQNSFSWLRSGLLVGALSVYRCAIGALATPSLANSKPAKPLDYRMNSLWCALIFTIGNVLQVLANYPYWYQLMCGRIVSGLGIGSFSILVLMYAGEHAFTDTRRAIVYSYQLFITIGIFVANILNNTLGTQNYGFTSWRFIHSIGCFGYLFSCSE
jgi:SP family sugar:H+ symporter-like MFS transporter